MDYRIEKIWKVIKKQMGSKDKMRYFLWIVNLITLNREEVNWVVGGPGVQLQQISK